MRHSFSIATGTRLGTTNIRGGRVRNVLGARVVSSGAERLLARCGSGLGWVGGMVERARPVGSMVSL